MSSKGCQDYHLLYGSMENKRYQEMSQNTVPNMLLRHKRTMALQGHYMILHVHLVSSFFGRGTFCSQPFGRSQGTQGLRQPTASVVPRLRSLGFAGVETLSTEEFDMMLGEYWILEYLLLIDGWNPETLQLDSLFHRLQGFDVSFQWCMSGTWTTGYLGQKTRNIVLCTEDSEWTRDIRWEISI